MTEIGHIAHQSICLAETNVLTPIPRLHLFWIKSYWQMTVGDLGWPQMTFRGVGNANFYSNCPQLSYTKDSTQIGLRQSKYNGVAFLPIDLPIMGRSQKWPDLRLQTSKIQDIRFVGTDDLIIVWKFDNFSWNFAAVARLESYFVVGSLDLTWWPDLTWHWVEIFTKVAEDMGVRWVKTWRRCAPPYFRYPRKTWGGRSNTLPPAGRGLRWVFPFMATVICYELRAKTTSKSPKNNVSTYQRTSSRQQTGKWD